MKRMGLAKNKDVTVSFREVITGLFKELLDGVPWETVLGDKGVNRAGSTLRIPS